MLGSAARGASLAQVSSAFIRGCSGPLVMLWIFGGRGWCVYVPGNAAAYLQSTYHRCKPRQVEFISHQIWPPLPRKPAAAGGPCGRVKCTTVQHVPSHKPTGAGGLLTKRSDTRLRTPCRRWFSWVELIRTEPATLCWKVQFSYVCDPAMCPCPGGVWEAAGRSKMKSFSEGRVFCRALLGGSRKSFGCRASIPY